MTCGSAKLNEICSNKSSSNKPSNLFKITFCIYHDQISVIQRISAHITNLTTVKRIVGD